MKRISFLNDMKRIGQIHRYSACLLLGLALTGCSKKEDATAPAPSAPTSSATAPAENNARSSAAVIDAKPVLAKIDTAYKAREYDEAADALLALQRQKLSEQQALEARNRMIQFQRDLAGAVAAGDPKAKAAADKLRASATVH
jgi:hypothetical protein